jgi:hypothetical protein
MATRHKVRWSSLLKSLKEGQRERVRDCTHVEQLPKVMLSHFEWNVGDV